VNTATDFAAAAAALATAPAAPVAPAAAAGIIAQLLGALAGMQLPADASAQAVSRADHEVHRISGGVGAALALATAHALAAQAANPGAELYQTPPAAQLLHLAAGSDSTDPAHLVARYQALQAAAQMLGIALQLGQAAGASPQPGPVLPMPAPPVPPAPVADPHAHLLPAPLPPLEAAAPEMLTYSLDWYFAHIQPEMQRHRWPDISPAGAQLHWQVHGRGQGRKWRADAPAPTWGPREENAPAGTRL
jgi:hypothetical protein